MTTTQYAQAISEAYQKFVTLFNSNAPQDAQDAQFERYMSIRREWLGQQWQLQQAWNALQAVPAYVERQQA
jgi:hypothetical protein